MSRDFPDFELGAVPPLGSLLGVPTYVDPEVMAHETVVFAGSQRESVKIRTAALFDDESITVVPLSLHPDLRRLLSGSHPTECDLITD